MDLETICACISSPTTASQSLCMGARAQGRGQQYSHTMYSSASLVPIATRGELSQATIKHQTEEHLGHILRVLATGLGPCTASKGCTKEEANIRGFPLGFGGRLRSPIPQQPGACWRRAGLQPRPRAAKAERHGRRHHHSIGYCVPQPPCTPHRPQWESVDD